MDLNKKQKCSLNEEIIVNQLSKTIDKVNFDEPGEVYSGKVRECLIQDNLRTLITTDRLSCFDKVITTVPFKGKVLNDLAVFWLDKTTHIVKNHLLDGSIPNTMKAVNAQVLPIELIVRGYLTGSAYRDYKAGKAISGIKLPDGLAQYHKFETPLITPSTKAEMGEHDMPISEAEILETKLVPQDLWNQIKDVSLKLFDYGSKEVAKRGLILVDTKYEFGLVNGELVLVDEIHTLDSSRYWKADSYPSALKGESDPIMLDKEPMRQWLISKGYMGEGDVPEISDDLRVELSKHYINSYEIISGLGFKA